MTDSQRPLIVVCLEGCHGAGKTELCKEFRRRGFTIQGEAFLDMPDYALHPQSLIMETTWVCSWFDSVLKQAASRQQNKHGDERSSPEGIELIILTQKLIDEPF